MKQHRLIPCLGRRKVGNIYGSGEIHIEYNRQNDNLNNENYRQEDKVLFMMTLVAEEEHTEQFAKTTPKYGKGHKDMRTDTVRVAVAAILLLVNIKHYECNEIDKEQIYDC
jgi:hypothetical protein